MAVIETWLKTDLKSIVRVNAIHGNVFSQDNMANLIGVELLDGGAPATVSGSVSANVLRANGTTVAVAGTLSGNKASVTLPQAAYAVPGMLAVVIKLTSGSTVTTIGAVQAFVYRSSTDTIIDPGTIIPSVQNLIDAIDAAVATVPASWAGLMADLAPTYSTSAVYPVGAYVYYDGDLYRCTTAITAAETWNAAHWTAAVLGDDVSDLKSDFGSIAWTQEANRYLIEILEKAVVYADVSEELQALKTILLPDDPPTPTPIYDYTMSDLTKLNGGVVVTSADPPVYGLNIGTYGNMPQNRRSFWLTDGDQPIKEIVTSGGTPQEMATSYYPIPIPNDASHVDVSVSPSAQLYFGPTIWKLTNGEYYRIESPGWENDTWSFDFTADDDLYLGITIKQGTGSSTTITTEPSAVSVHFE